MSVFQKGLITIQIDGGGGHSYVFEYALAE